MKSRRIRKRFGSKKDFIFFALSFAWLTSMFMFTALILDAFGHRCILRRFWQGASTPEVSPHATSSTTILERVVNSSVRKIQYHAFRIEEPLFISSEDRELFLGNLENMDSLGEQSQNRLWGGISVVENGTVDSDIDCGWKTRDEMYKTTQKRYQRRYQFLVPLLVPQSNTFQHFLDGVVPKLIQGGDLIKEPNITILLFRPWDRIVEEVLTKLGIPTSNIAYYDGGYYWAKYLINICTTPPIHPYLWNKARRELGAFEDLQTSLKEALVVLLVRTKARNGGRYIVNKQEVTSFLKDRYGTRTRVYTGSEHLDEAISFFGSVRILIGVHGGAFYNMNFCPKQTAIVEIMPTNYTTGNPVPAGLAQTIVWKMAQLLQQTYWRVHERSLTKAGNVNVDIDKLARILDIIDSRQSVQSAETGLVVNHT